MTHRETIIGLLALPIVLLMACEPDAADRETEAEAAEAPPITRPATPFDEWDADQSRTLQREEFAQWSEDEGIFDDWLGEDGLDRTEFGERVHGILDLDDDGTVTEDEWRQRASTLFDEPRTWSDWDGDGDSELDVNEVAESVERFGVFEEVDGDGDMLIDDEEIGDFFFDVFDMDDDNALAPTEWGDHEGWLGG